MSTGKIARLITVWGILLVSTAALAADWPQFRGLHRDGKSPETGLLKSWPEGGPALLWQAEGLGTGWSSAAIARGRVYITGMLGRDGILFCFDLNGKQLWQANYGPEWRGSYPGARDTPTIDGDRVYVITGNGLLSCYDAQSGRKKWAVDTKKKFHGARLSWGISESVLVADGYAVCTPGGPDASVVALDKLTGATVWTSKGLSEKHSYATAILIERGGRKIVVTQLSESLVGVDLQTGRVLWKGPFRDYQGRSKAINPVSPLYHNGQIYITSGYDDGGALYDLSPDGSSIRLKWSDRTLDNHHGGVVLVDGFIYGANWKGNGNGDWVCLEWNSGKVIYEDRWNGNKGPVIYADGMLYCRDEKTGDVALVPAVPRHFKPVSSFRITRGRGPHWAHPSISDGRLYIRQGQYLFVYDIRKK